MKHEVAVLAYQHDAAPSRRGRRGLRARGAAPSLASIARPAALLALCARLLDLTKRAEQLDLTLSRHIGAGHPKREAARSVGRELGTTKVEHRVLEVVHKARARRDGQARDGLRALFLRRCGLLVEGLAAAFQLRGKLCQRRRAVDREEDDRARHNAAQRGVQFRITQLDCIVRARGAAERRVQDGIHVKRDHRRGEAIGHLDEALGRSFRDPRAKARHARRGHSHTWRGSRRSEHEVQDARRHGPQHYRESWRKV